MVEKYNILRYNIKVHLTLLLFDLIHWSNWYFALESVNCIKLDIHVLFGRFIDCFFSKVKRAKINNYGCDRVVHNCEKCTV